MTDYHHKSLTELSTLLQSGEASSVALTEHFLARIKRFDRQPQQFHHGRG